MTAHQPTGGMITTHRTSAQLVAMLFGIVFILVGVAGFVPGLTENTDDLKFADRDSTTQLLGLFQVSVLHNIVHLLFGIVGIAAAMRWRNARSYLVIGGLIYLVLFAYGSVISLTSDANFVPVNTADNWLHLGLGIAMVAFGAMTWNRAVDSEWRRP